MTAISSSTSRPGGRRGRVTAAILGTCLAIGCGSQGKPGHVLDEAMRAHRTAASFPAADEDYFHDMDGAVPLTREEIQGRNMWIVWTGGNDRFWDGISETSVGNLDYLKTASSHPSLPYSRDNRFRILGLVNEPCFKKATAPDPNRYGLWLDVRDPSCPPDPFANATKYPGVQIGSRGKTLPVGSYYGEPTGIVGLRLFPNPDFDEAAKRKWDSERYYRDPSYYNSSDLVKPYRVGVACGFCHVGPDPVRPPADPENPEWRNLNSTVGAQFFWVDRIFNWRADTNKDSFFYQLLHTSKPGTLDTSLVSSDNINNPRTMNAVYLLGARMGLAAKWGKERLAGGGLDNRQFNDFVPAGDPLASFFKPPDTTYTPRVLKDGADSVGALGALNRVYLNIGLFSEEWLLHFRPVIGGQKITPIKIADARKNSVYWQSTELQTPNMARFLLKATPAHHLKDAPGGAMYQTETAEQLRQGKVVFAERCARCHSSKVPDLPPGLDLADCNGKDYLSCWDRYWAWTKTDDFKSQMRTMVLADDFLTDNYLSTELRVPSTLLQTNICSPIATNAIAGDIWDNFSSASYKELPSVGSMTLRNPMNGAAITYQLPGGGRGFTRPASLVSVWSTAPFLQNNRVGRFDPSPSVEARMRTFNDAIEKMLWPEKREKDHLFDAETGPGIGVIDRTDAVSEVYVPAGYVPSALRPLLGLNERLFPFLFRNGGIRLGPIPQGFPVNLLANLDMLGPNEQTEQQKKERVRNLLQLFRGLIDDLKHGRDAFNNDANVKLMLALSKCNDYVVNKGHYFGTSLLTEEPGLSDDDKRALIGFLKTM
jgi:hypothetical protein